MKKYIKILGVALVALLILGACTEKFDTPPAYTPVTDQDIADDGYTLITIADIKNYYYDEYPDYDNGGGISTAGNVEIVEAVAIKGKVISSDFYGNVYRSLWIQDATGGMEVKIGLNSLYTDYTPGTWVYIKAQGLILGNYRFNLSLGTRSADPRYANGYMDIKAVVREHVFVGEREGLNASDTLVMTAANVQSLINGTFPVTTRKGVENINFNRRYLNTLVRFEGIESIWGQATGDSAYGSDEFPQYLVNRNTGTWAQYNTYTFRETIAEWQRYETTGGTIPVMPRPGTLPPQDPSKPFITYYTWAFRNIGESYYGTSLWRLGTSYFSVRSSGYSRFALSALPQNGATGDMTAILTRYSSSSGGFRKYQLQLNYENDVRVF